MDSTKLYQNENSSLELSREPDGKWLQNFGGLYKEKKVMTWRVVYQRRNGKSEKGSVLSVLKFVRYHECNGFAPSSKVYVVHLSSTEHSKHSELNEHTSCLVLCARQPLVYLLIYLHNCSMSHSTRRKSGTTRRVWYREVLRKVALVTRTSVVVFPEIATLGIEDILIAGGAFSDSVNWHTDSLPCAKESIVRPI